MGGHLVGGHHVHVEEPDDLVSCDPSPEVRVIAESDNNYTQLVDLKA